jgi:hypothetical protein
MHESVLKFVMSALQPHEVAGKSVLEVGSYNVNGSVRPYIESLGPSRYLGIDICEGPGVDLVEDITTSSRNVSFDVVISTEMLEHAEDWYAALSRMQQLCNETLILTARGPGFPFHNPPDHWRFTCDDIRRVLHPGVRICHLGPDPQVPGVFLKAVRPGRPAPQKAPKP